MRVIVFHPRARVSIDVRYHGSHWGGSIYPRASNICFGGYRNSRLFITASHSAFAIYLRIPGVIGG